MNRVRGFTLMEVMIALTILSMMMVAIVSSLRTFANTRATLETKTNRVDEIRMVSAFLRRSLEATMSSGGGSNVPTFDIVDDQQTYFFGTSSGLTWVAPMVGGAGFGGVNFMRLNLDGEELVLHWQPYRRDMDPVDWNRMKARTLVKDVEEYSVSYRSSYGGEWQEAWSDSASSPVSVRMNIKAGGKYWPELLVRLD